MCKSKHGSGEEGWGGGRGMTFHANQIGSMAQSRTTESANTMQKTKDSREEREESDLLCGGVQDTSHTEVACQCCCCLTNFLCLLENEMVDSFLGICTNLIAGLVVGFRSRPNSVKGCGKEVGESVPKEELRAQWRLTWDHRTMGTSLVCITLSP
jgi:hypothetical protein